MPKSKAAYEVWIIPPGKTEYVLRGATNDQDGAELYCEQSVMFGPNTASKVVEVKTGRIILETES